MVNIFLFAANFVPIVLNLSSDPEGNDAKWKLVDPKDKGIRSMAYCM